MGIRESLNQNPAVASGAVIGIVVLAMIFLVYNYAGNKTPGADGAAQAYFSDDDGKSYFPDDARKVTPFDHNGKSAVLCFVFSCDDSKTKFVGYLQRYTPEGKKMRESQLKPAGPKMGVEEMIIPIEVKKPGDKEWVRTTDPRFAAIASVRCPDGSMNNLTQITPE